MTKNTNIEMAELKKDLQYAIKKIDEGFKGVHERQDTTNGKVLRNTENIAKIETNVENWSQKCLTKEEYMKELLKNSKLRIKINDNWKEYLIKTVIGLAITIALLWIGAFIGGHYG